MKVYRYLDRDKVRQMCIRYNYYTHGDCEAYEKMLNMAGRTPDREVDYLNIALDIYNHSNICGDEEYTKEDLVAGVMYGLYNECTETIVEIEEGEV